MAPSIPRLALGSLRADEKTSRGLAAVSRLAAWDRVEKLYATAAPALRRYFSSGWAFFIPYLLLYRLYAWQKWPANAVGATAAEGIEQSANSWIPPLLYVYWTLHVAHFALVAVALRSWWSDAKCKAQSAEGRLAVPTNPSSPSLSSVNKDPKSVGDQSSVGSKSAFSLQLSAFSTALRAVTPWLLLTLLFAIPGVYLEWPADPWEHLRRITEWQIHPAVTGHSAGYKSFYFFAYSCVGWLSPSHLLSWLEVYYVGICLLLAWQYYLLAKAVGLDRRWAFLFVVINALTFGNSVFSFYRYYGISSSIFAQLGAVALTRIALEYAKSLGGRAKREERSAKGGEQRTGSQEQSAEREELRAMSLERRAKGEESAATRQVTKAAPHGILTALTAWFNRRSAWRNLYTTDTSSRGEAYTRPPLIAAAALLLLIAYNHIQGVGIAGLGVAAIIIWRLIAWKRSMVYWLGAAAVVLSLATILWWPRHPNIDAVFRPSGWLNAWYGFDLFSFEWTTGGASDRMMQILGLFGLFNLAAGLVLLRRNHVVGWLTVAPILALSLPFVAIPFANSIATTLIVYHRIFFALPAGLALIYLIQQRYEQRVSSPSTLLLPWTTRAAAIAALVVVSPQGPWHNRFWQAVSVTPEDLQLKPVMAAVEPAAAQLQKENPIRLISTPAVSYLFNVFGPREFPPTARVIGRDHTAALLQQYDLERSADYPLHRKLPERSLAADPMAAEPSSWTTLAGSPPEFVAIGDFCASSTALQNPIGLASEVFMTPLIPIDPAQNYCVEFSALRRAGGVGAISYLAVSWHDVRGRLLRSDHPSPTGAGNPIGWRNATYSYFGLVGETAPAVWTTYRKTFGPSESAAVPTAARFARLGALLNYSKDPAGVVQITNIQLWAITGSDIAPHGAFLCVEEDLVIVPSFQTLATCGSQAARASAHWSAYEVPTDEGGNTELAAEAARGRISAENFAGVEVFAAPSKNLSPNRPTNR